MLFDVRMASRNDNRLVGPVGNGRFARLASTAANDVILHRDSFFGKWQTRNAAATIPHCIKNLETSGVLHNFRRIADGEAGPFQGMWFADSDLYKTLEAIGWESSRLGYGVHQDFVDQAVDLISRTQDESGYINTAVQGDPEKTRWSELVWSHELYCAGHLFQAAVALHRGVGDARLLEIALRFARLIRDELANHADRVDGHPEVESALVELYRETHEEWLLHVAADQIERRGAGVLPHGRWGREYFLDHMPVRDANEATGHAVRQIYLSTGVADLYLETGDRDLLSAAERIWDSAQGTKTYLTGGQGSRHADEAFGDAYELPSDRAYAETCAGIASFQWAWRMLLATGDEKYADAMETVLYNGIAASVSTDGTRFFYTNPLQMRTGHRGVTENSPNERLSWFDCACCPPNLARLISSLASYVATLSTDGLQLHHLVACDIDTTVGEASVHLTIRTNAPWDKAAYVDIRANGEFELLVRVPRWAAGHRVLVDGRPAQPRLDGYIAITRDWSDGVTIHLEFDNTPVIMNPHPRIDAVRGTAAIRRGPVVYCIESADHPDVPYLEDIQLDTAGDLTEVATGIPEAQVAIRATGVLRSSPAQLYSDTVSESTTQDLDVLAIPYFAWGNRGRGAMRVWIPTQS